MTNTKVTYFDFPAAGEPIRLLLAYGGREFEDIRIKPENWPEIKPTIPFGQLPIYEEDGKVANQSTAICRYLGNNFKLSGDNDWENLEIDAIADTLRDFIFKVAINHYEKSASAKEKMKEEMSKAIDFYLEKFDSIAMKNNGHFAINKLTWADFYWAGMVDYICLMIEVNIKEKYPNLDAVRDNVMKLPAVVKVYENHPINWDAVQQWIKISGTSTEP